MLKRREKKRKKQRLTSVQKIQLHINKYLGRPTGRKVPQLNDQEYLIFQNRIMALRNEKIGSTFSNFSSPAASVFQTPLMLNEPTYPQPPANLPLQIPPVISAGYETIRGQIIPAPLPTAMEDIGASTSRSKRLIGGPNQNERTDHSVSATFGMHTGGGVARHGHQHVPLSSGETKETPVRAEHVFHPPAYIGPSIAVESRAIQNAQRLEQHQALAAGMRAAGMATGQEQARKPAGEHQAGKPKGYKQGDIRKADVKAQENLDLARKKLADLQAEEAAFKEGKAGFPKGGTRHTKKMDTLNKALQVAQDRLARREKEMENLQMGHGFGRGEKQGLGRQRSEPSPRSHSAEATQNLHEGKPATPRFTDIHTATPSAAATPITLNGNMTMAPDVQSSAEMGYVPQPSLPVGEGAPLPPAPGKKKASHAPPLKLSPEQQREMERRAYAEALLAGKLSREERGLSEKD